MVLVNDDNLSHNWSTSENKFSHMDYLVNTTFPILGVRLNTTFLIGATSENKFSHRE